MMSLRRLSRWRHRPLSDNFVAHPSMAVAATQSDRPSQAVGPPRSLLFPSPIDGWTICIVRHASSSSGSRWKGRGVGERVLEGGKTSVSDHKYARIGGPIDRTACELSETEISNLIHARAQCKRARDFRRADRIQEELQRNGVFVDDRSREWRADGKSAFPRQLSSRERIFSSARARTDGNASERFPSRNDTHRMPRMKDCQTMDEAILAVHNNLEKASHRDLSAFWAVVPRLLPRGGRQQIQQMVPQLTSIFNKTAEKIGDFGPRDLVSTTLAFAKTVDALGDIKKKNQRGGAYYHDCLQGILADRRDVIFQFIASTAVPVLSRTEARHLANLAYAYGLLEYAPTFDDGKTLFHHIAEASIPLLRKFEPQNISNTVWAFVKAGVSHAPLFERIADHIVSLDHLNEYEPQHLSNTLNAFAKAEVSHPALFDKVGDHIVSLEHLNEFKPQELSNTLNAFAKAGVSHPPLFEKMGDHIYGREDLNGFDPQALANTVNAFAKAEVSHPALFERIADHIIAREDLHEYNSQDVANTLNAFAKAGASHPALFEKIGNHIIAREDLHEFGPQALSNTVWAFAKAGVSHPPLFEKVATHILSLEITNDFSAQHIANLAWAYQKAGMKNRRLFDKLLIAAVEKRDEFSERTIQNFLRWTEGDD